MDDALAQLDKINAWERRRGTQIGNLLVLSVADAETAAGRDYLLKGIMAPAELSLWVGPPKCGKSFLMLYISYLLSLGQPIFGRRAKLTRVLYVAAEGEAGIANRIRALRDRYGPSEMFHFIAQPADLLHEPGHKQDLKNAATAYQTQLVVLDTLNRVLAGGDENSSQDMGALVLFMADLRHETKAHIAAVHHGTKLSGGSNPRGHSCLTGADDALIEIARNDDGSRTAKVVHAKDDADGHEFGFRLEVVDLGSDSDGDPITTLIVEESPGAGIREKTTRLTPNEVIALRTLDQATRIDGLLATVGADHQPRKVVRASDWRTWFYRDGKPGESQETKQKAFKRAVNNLLAKQRIVSRDEFVWRPEISS